MNIIVWIRWLLGAWLAAFLFGCNTVPTAFPQEFAVAAKQLSTSVADQAVWSDIVAGLDGQVIEPGIETYAGVLYVAGAKLPGTSGQINLASKGAGNGQLSPEARQAILALANQYNVSPEQVVAIIQANQPKPMEPAGP